MFRNLFAGLAFLLTSLSATALAEDSPNWNTVPNIEIEATATVQWPERFEGTRELEIEACYTDEGTIVKVTNGANSVVVKHDGQTQRYDYWQNGDEHLVSAYDPERGDLPVNLLNPLQFLTATRNWKPKYSEFPLMVEGTDSDGTEFVSYFSGIHKFSNFTQEVCQRFNLQEGKVMGRNTINTAIGPYGRNDRSVIEVRVLSYLEEYEWLPKELEIRGGEVEQPIIQGTISINAVRDAPSLSEAQERFSDGMEKQVYVNKCTPG